MVGQGWQVEQRTVGKQRHLGGPGHVRNQRATADIDEDVFGGKQRVADADGPGPFETRVAPDQGASREALEPVLVAGAAVPGNLLRPGVHARHVDRDGPRDHAVICAAPCQMRRIGGRYQSLGWLAPGVDASAADQVPFDDRDFPSGRGQAPGQRRAGLPCADDDRVIGSVHRVRPRGQ